MHRRAILLSLPFAAASMVLPPSQPEHFGTLTVEGWTMHKRRTGKELRVFFNGEDVTTRCKRANDRRGYVVLLDGGNGLWRVHRGRVEIIERG